MIRPALIGAVLTGGASDRFGSDKAATIGPIVVAAMRAAGVDPVVAVGGRTAALGIPTLPDRYPGEGPLGGLATALSYARTGWVLLTPCDHPLLRGVDLVPLLDRLGSLDSDQAAVATVDGTPHPSLACWPASWARKVHENVRSGERRYRRALDLGEWVGVEITASAVEDADDPNELQRLLAQRPDTGPHPSGPSSA